MTEGSVTRVITRKERFNRAFSDRIYELMAEKSITGHELARRSMVPAGTIRLLKDGIGTVSLLTALDLAEALEVSLDELVRNCFESRRC